MIAVQGQENHRSELELIAKISNTIGMKTVWRCYLYILHRHTYTSLISHHPLEQSYLTQYYSPSQLRNVCLANYLETLLIQYKKYPAHSVKQLALRRVSNHGNHTKSKQSLAQSFVMPTSVKQTLKDDDNTYIHVNAQGTSFTSM